MPDPEILTLETAADLFGVSVKTFIKLLREEKVPGRKIGREWRFSRRALIDWLSTGDSQIYSLSEGETKDFFNTVAPEWEDLRKDYYDQSVVERLLNLGLLHKKMTLVDLGAGNGYLTRPVAPHVAKVLAVDISAAMLRELMQKARAEGLKNIEPVESDGREIPIPDGSIDLVCAAMYLHHIEDPEPAILEMSRVLKPGGAVYLADFHTHTDDHFRAKMHDHWPGFDPAEIKQRFTRAGFADLHLETLPNQGPLKIFVLTGKKG